MIISIIIILLQATTLGLNIGHIYIFVRHGKKNLETFWHDTYSNSKQQQGIISMFSP